MLTLFSLAGTEPVTLADAKVAARVDSTDLDAFITGAITAAREQAEQITGRSYRQKVLREQLVDWPATDAPINVFAPSACAITYWNGSTWATLAGAAFAFFPLDPGGTGIAPAYGTSWPTLGDIAGGPRVRVDLTLDAPAAIPEAVKLYIKASVAAWVQTSEALAADKLVPNPLHERLLDAERLYA